MQPQHVIHSNVPADPKINLKLIRNSRGVNWEITAMNFATVEEALEAIQQAETQLAALYGQGDNEDVS